MAKADSKWERKAYSINKF